MIYEGLMKNTNQQKEPAKVQISHERHYSSSRRFGKIRPYYTWDCGKNLENGRKRNDIIHTAKISIIFAFICVLILSGLSFYAIHLGYAAMAGAFLYKPKRTRNSI